jgi:hypothetical protein
LVLALPIILQIYMTVLAGQLHAESAETYAEAAALVYTLQRTAHDNPCGK